VRLVSDMKHDDRNASRVRPQVSSDPPRYGIHNIDKRFVSAGEIFDLRRVAEMK